MRWARSLDVDLQHLISTHGVDVVVCLLSDAELRALGVGRDYAARVKKAGLELIQLPIIEMFAPGDMVYVYMYVCVRVCVCVCVHMHTRVYIYTYNVHIYVYMCICNTRGGRDSQATCMMRARERERERERENQKRRDSKKERERERDTHTNTHAHKHTHTHTHMQKDAMHVIEKIVERLQDGQKCVLHCRGGVGRCLKGLCCVS